MTGKPTEEQLLQRHGLKMARGFVRDIRRLLALPNRSPDDIMFALRLNLACLKMFWMVPYLTEEQRIQIRGMYAA